ncbi:hypothetical protein Tcan_01991 [Toxocara canis]|uniref:Uncharacterized protein n=1 Tax=Toxocara canis TaxID=6265 RepID=A0A0B2VLC6_TOXCA|nr:hypothetical protein Tcan_01991 [Toxocara canis]
MSGETHKVRNHEGVERWGSGTRFVWLPVILNHETHIEVVMTDIRKGTHGVFANHVLVAINSIAHFRRVMVTPT